jgi:hypothetical protein
MSVRKNYITSTSIDEPVEVVPRAVRIRSSRQAKVNMPGYLNYAFQEYRKLDSRTEQCFWCPAAKYVTISASSLRHCTTTGALSKQVGRSLDSDDAHGGIRTPMSA